MKNLKNVLKELKKEFKQDEREEIIKNMQEEEGDFEVAGHRFIREDNIDSIMKDELLSDKYTLGCCNSWFIAEITGIDENIIKKGQKVDNYELLGELMAKKIDIDGDIIEKGQKVGNYELLGELMAKKIDRVVLKMVAYDSYGHHFGHYDGAEHEILDYYYFRLN